MGVNIMMKNKKIILSVIVILLSIFFIMIIVSDTKTGGIESMDISNFKDTDTVLQVGEKKISKKDFENIVLLYGVHSKSEVEDIITYNIALKNLALEAGINPTVNEVEEYIATIREILNEEKDIKKDFDKFLKQIGRDEKEYWDDPENLQRYKTALMASNYRQLILNSMVEDNRDIEFEELHTLVSEAVQEKVDEERANLQIIRYYEN